MRVVTDAGALERCRQDLLARPSCRIARYHSLLVELALGRWSDAVEAATAALDGEVSADGVAALGGYSDALEPVLWRKLRGEILVWRGYARVMLEDFAGCIADCDAAIALDPNDAFALLHKGHALGLQALDRRESLDAADEMLGKVFRAAGVGRYSADDESRLKATAERLRQAFRKKERQW